MSAESAVPTDPHRGRRLLTFLIAPIVAMIVAGYVADALWPSLVNENPLLLISLSAKNRYLVLVVNHVEPWAYFLIGSIRLLLPDPFFFAIGWFFGAAALRWMERRTPTTGRYMRAVEGWFGKWGAPLVVLFPNNYVCLVAGAARMNPIKFAVLNIVDPVRRRRVFRTDRFNSRLHRELANSIAHRFHLARCHFLDQRTTAWAKGNRCIPRT